jgi:hypothetical protein
MRSTEVLEAMEAGSRLYREFHKIELIQVDGQRLPVPTAIFDGLVDEFKIEAQGSSGYYRLVKA